MIHIYATVVFSMFVLLVIKHDHTEKLYLFFLKGVVDVYIPQKGYFILLLGGC